MAADLISTTAEHIAAAGKKARQMALEFVLVPTKKANTLVPITLVWRYQERATYQGEWQRGRRSGLGVETRGRWEYRGEWSQGLKGRYGLRQSLHSQANYLGTWSAGLHDGYGTETYVDGGTYKGQWQRGLRHGYGIRTSAPYKVAAKYYRSRSQTNASLTSLRSDLAVDDPATSKKDKKKDQNDDDEFRGGFVLRVRSEAPARRRRSLSERSLAVKRTILSNLRIKKQHSTGDIHQRVTSTSGSLRSSGSTMSCTSDDESEQHRNQHDFTSSPEERIEGTVIETYKGEWKNDKRSGFGICERTDNVKYAGEWFNNRKHGYGITFFKDGTKEEGRYKNNVLVCSTRRKGIMFVRSSKLRERIEASVEAAKRAADMAEQRVEITLSRTQTAQERAEQAIEAAKRARDDADTARICAIQFDPTFQQPGIEHMRQNRSARHGVLENHVYTNHVSFESTASATHSSPHHRLPSGPPSTLSAVDPSISYAAQLPNFAPQSIYQQQQPQQLAAPQQTSQTQQSAAHFNSAIQPQQVTAELHPHTSAHVDPIIQIQQPQHQTHYTDEQASQMSRVDAEAARLLQAQQISPVSLSQQQQLPSNSLHFTPTDPNRSVQTGNSIGNRLQTPSSIATEPSTHEAPTSRIRHMRNAAEGRSTMSLSDDHYDQYTMNRANSGGAQLRRNRPSLTRQTEVLADAVHLNRRSTLASSRDRQGTSRGCDSMFGWQPAGAVDGDRGSLPNLDELMTHGVSLRREDAARLASQRRQEAQRLLEEEELMRSNPLRYLFYNPALRNWIRNNRGIIVLVAFNAALIYVLFFLLTYERPPQD
ncbi:Junctophilin-3 [Aphelenchoides besseyi]|nr:Junctophilin-3 [Aphelenchoides besseyi]